MNGINFVAYGAVVVLGAMAPGPDFLIVTKHGTTGRRPGLAAAAGVAGGMAVNTAAALLGLGAIFLASPRLYAAVRVIAALYVVSLGVRALLAVPGMRRHAAQVATPIEGEGTEDGLPVDRESPWSPLLVVAPASTWTAFRQGLLTNFLNPKVVIFLLTLTPQFMSRTPSISERVIIFVVSVVSVLLYFTALALLVAQFSRFLQRPRVNLVITAVTGVALVVIGVEIAVSAL